MSAEKNKKFERHRQLGLVHNNLPKGYTIQSWYARKYGQRIIYISIFMC